MALFLLCVGLVWPVAETGLMDDFAYVRTAEVLARTGHVVYNGWATALLGWPLYVAAGLMRVFGASFTAARMTDVLLGAACVGLLHRLLLRVGVNGWNAGVVTCGMAVSPVFVASSVTFMSDMAGLLAVLVCVYGCLRAVAEPERAVGWILLASAGNVALGTARQIAWLGVLVMVPAAVWVLRRRRAVVVAGAASVAVGVGVMWAAVRWFEAQPYSVAERVVVGRFRFVTAQNVVAFLLRLAFDAVLMSLPVALGFWPALRRIGRGRAAALGVGVAAFVPLLWHEARRREYLEWMSPMFLYTPSWPHSVETMFTNLELPIKGASEVPLTWGWRAGMTAVCVVGLSCVLAGTIAARGEPTAGARRERRRLGWLVGPYAAAYVLLLMPRGLTSFTYDRYLLLLLPVVLLWLARWYQDRIGARLPGWSVAVLVGVAAYSVTSFHDVFAAYRAVTVLTGAMQARGVPRVDIDAGWEFNSYTEILVSGYVKQPGARLADGRVLGPIQGSFAGPCSRNIPQWTPSLHPRYTVANRASVCAPVEGYAPVVYGAWLPPFRREVYVARYVAVGRP